MKLLTKPPTPPHPPAMDNPRAMSCFPHRSGIIVGTSLVLQWLRLWAPNSKGQGSIPGRGIRSHIVFQLLSYFRLFATPWTAARQASLSTTNSRRLLKLISIESVMPSNHLILCCPLFLPPSIFPSIRVFSNESVLHIRWPKYWSFGFSISQSNEHWTKCSGLISFRIDWLDLLAI